MNKKKNINKMAMTMFVLLSHLIPLPSPEIADNMNKIVTPIIIKICVLNPTGILLFKYEKPPLIWIAPNPRDVATPNTVANTAIISIVFPIGPFTRSEEHTSELQSRGHLVCRLLLEKKKKNKSNKDSIIQ